MSTEHRITRRQAVRTAGALGAAYVLGPQLIGAAGGGTAIASSSCAQLTPELTEGPYWVNTMLHRSDVRANAHGGGHQAGVLLLLTVNVVDSSTGCKPLNGVAVDIWHANAHGLYSDESSQQAGGGTTGGNTISDNWLRGYQITGKDRGVKSKPVHGQVSFKTIWPGWYASRAIHIHVRVRELSHSGATIAGYTTQIFFSDAGNDHVLTNASPYSGRSPQKDPTTDENDTVLSKSDFATNVVKVKGRIGHGYRATFNIALDNAEVDAKGSLSRPNTGGGTGPGVRRSPRGARRGAKLHLMAGGGNDTLIGGPGNDTLDAGPGNDTLIDMRGRNIALFGGPGNDTLVSSGEARGGMFAGSGNDTLVMHGKGPVVLVGGTGKDTFYLLDGASAQSVVARPGGGTKTIVTDHSLTMPPNVEVVRATPSANHGRGITLRAGTGNQTLIGSNGNDTLIAGPGSDYLDGRGGNNTLVLSAWGDTRARGGGGANRFVVLATPHRILRWRSA